MKELYKDKYVTFSYDSTTKIMYEHWTPLTEDMGTDEVKELMKKLVSFFEIYQPLYYFSYAVDFKYFVSVEMQTWIDNLVTPVALKCGMKKIARIMSEDFIAQLSLEQFVDEKNQSLIENKFFDNTEDALIWIKS